MQTLPGLVVGSLAQLQTPGNVQTWLVCAARLSGLALVIAGSGVQILALSACNGTEQPDSVAECFPVGFASAQCCTSLADSQ